VLALGRRAPQRTSSRINLGVLEATSGSSARRVSRRMLLRRRRTLRLSMTAAPRRRPGGTARVGLPADAVEQARLALSYFWSRVGLRRRDGRRVRRLSGLGRRVRPSASRRGRQSWAVSLGTRGSESIVEPDTAGDMCGHGTACAGIVRSPRARVRARLGARPR
jgi:hypothetical protein